MKVSGVLLSMLLHGAWMRVGVCGSSILRCCLLISRDISLVVLWRGLSVQVSCMICDSDNDGVSSGKENAENWKLSVRGSGCGTYSFFDCSVNKSF